MSGPVGLHWPRQPRRFSLMSCGRRGLGVPASYISQGCAVLLLLRRTNARCGLGGLGLFVVGAERRTLTSEARGLSTAALERMRLQPSATAVVFRFSPAAPALGRRRPC